MQVCMLARWSSAAGISRKAVPKSTLPSLRVLCHSQPRGNADAKVQEPRGVFQMTPQRGEATLLDARCVPANGCTPSVLEILETCGSNQQCLPRRFNEADSYQSISSMTV